jgi:hypothetical protein
MSDEQRGGGAPTDEERARAIREQLKGLRAFDLAYSMMIELVRFGYQKLGLTDDTSELRDLDDARLAIELLRATLEVVEREQGAGRTRDVRSTLAQMQLGYAQAVHSAGAAARPRVAQPSADEPTADEPAADDAVVEEAAPDKAPARKPAAGKPVSRRPAAAKKTAAKKPTAKKPTPEKPTPKKPTPKKPRGGATPSAG